MNKFDATVKELKEDINELEKDFSKVAADLDEAGRIKAREIVEKTEKTINLSIEKVNSVINDISDEKKLNELLDKIKAKAKEATDYAMDKVVAIANNEDAVDIDALHDDIMNEFDKLKETDVYKKTTVLVKEGYAKINEFLEKPEVKKAINKAKITTLKAAELGVETLKKVLESEGTKKKAAPKKVETIKTATKKAPAKKKAATTTKKKTAAKKSSTKKTTKKIAE